MNLENIKSTTTWAEASGTMNNNNAKITEAIERLESAVEEGGGGGTADSVAWNKVTGKPSWITDSKPVYAKEDLSQGVQTSLDKADTALQAIPDGYATEEYTREQVRHILNLMSTALEGKVDKVDGKQLSTEDFTTALKEKLEAISSSGGGVDSEALQALSDRLDLIVSGGASGVIDSFADIVAFLMGINDSVKLKDMLDTLRESILRKQNTIEDLDAIRSGAALGATAVQRGESVAHAVSADRAAYAEAAPYTEFATYSGGINANQPMLALPTEANGIFIVDNEDGAITTNSVSVSSSIKKAIQFNWYNEPWEIGNVRGTDAYSEGFGITSGKDNLCFLVTKDGCYANGGRIIVEGDSVGHALFAESAANADTLDGMHGYSYFKSIPLTGDSIDFNNLTESGVYMNTVGNISDYQNAPFNYGYLLAFNTGNGYAKSLQIATSSIGDEIKVRQFWANRWTPWKSLAFTDGNVASADKAAILQGVESDDFSGTDLELNMKLFSGVSAGAEGLFPYGSNANAVLTVNKHRGNYNSQLGFSSNGLLYYRNGSNEVLTTQPWKQIAFTSTKVDSSVSADKLQTPIKLWGNGFDGSGSIDGSIFMASNTAIYGTTAEGVQEICLIPRWSDGKTYFNYGSGGLVVRNNNNEIEMVLNASGNVGIGTTEPAYKLEVVSGAGNVAVFDSSSTSLESSILYRSSDGKFWAVGKGTGVTGDSFGFWSATKGDNVLMMRADGCVGIGTNDPRNELDILNNGEGLRLLSRNDKSVMLIQNVGGMNWEVGAMNNNIFAIRSTVWGGNVIVCNHSGDVGIGTSTLSARLNVGGSANVTENISVGGNATIGGTAAINGNSLQCRVLRDGANQWIIGKIDDENGAIGIGSVNSTQPIKLENLNGNAVLGSDGKFSISGDVSIGGTSTLRDVRMSDAIAIRMGVGTTISEDYALSVGGDVSVSGYVMTEGVSMYSQRSLKDVVDEEGLSLEELATIKPTRFTWKDGRDEKVHIGGIADDVQKVLPEAVRETPEGILTMDYPVASFAVASSLVKPVTNHEERIAELERENKQLREELEMIKRYIGYGNDK